MKIILSGGGSGEKTKELDERFARLLDLDKPLLYIPVAMDETKKPYDQCLQWLKGTFDKLGVSSYEMWTEEELKNISSSPENFGGIYIGGGNTYYLLEILKKTGFWEFLKESVQKNIPIYGGSAGATIFGKSVLTSKDDNQTGLKEFGGMNLLNELSIFCHYKKEKEEILNKRMSKAQIRKVIALPDSTGIHIKYGESPRVIGKEPAILFEDSNKVSLEPDSKVY